MINDDSYSSIDRLMEFGMGIAVARQMIDTMNYTMENMRVPGAGNPLNPSNAQYYALVDNQQCGPLSEVEAEKLVADGHITRDTLVWKVGSLAWRKAKDVPEILKMLLLLNK